MKTTIKLGVTAEEFFKVITDSVISDVRKVTNRAIHRSQIKAGFKYKKVLPNRFKTNAEVLVKVLNCVLPIEYDVLFESAIDYTYVSYRVEKEYPDGIDASYEEKYELKNDQKTLHRQFSFFGKNYLLKRNMKKGKKILRQIENYIKLNRDKHD